MKKNRNMKLAAGFLLMAGLSAPALGSDAITFDPDGPGGNSAISDIVTFDWTPGNTLAVGGNAAVQTFIGTSTGIHSIVNTVTSDVRVEITAGGDPPTLGADEAMLTSQFVGGTSNPFSVFYQAKLAGFVKVGGDPGSPESPPGLNTSYEITAVARFDERVSTVFVDFAAGTANVNFAHVPNADEYLEIYYGAGAAFNASDLNGTGFNDGVKILEADILAGPGLFTSNFAASLALDGSLITDVLDKVNPNDYLGLTTITGIGSTQFTAQVTDFDPAFFVDVLSTVGFTAETENTQGLPFTKVDPSSAFLVNSAGTAEFEAPVTSGAGDPTDPIYGIGSVNGQFLGAGGGPSIQFQADASTSFERVSGVVPEPATAALGLMGLAGLALGRRRNHA